MSDRILGAVCVVAAAGMAWAAQDYAAAISYEPVGPARLPAAAGGADGHRRRLAGAEADTAQRHVQRRARCSRSACAPLTVVIYALLFQWLGFTLATAVMAVPVGMAFGGSWKQSLAGGVGLGLVLFLLFDKLLDVVLPTGLLSFILGGR